MNLKEKIDKLEAKREALSDEISRLGLILFSHPDAEIHTNRWGTERVHSVDVNSKATGCEIAHSCGCCTDAAVYAFPYMDVAQGRIYSSPPCFTVGEGSDYGDVADAGWKFKLKEAGIAQAAIDVIAEHFRHQIADRRRELEEELAELDDEELAAFNDV